MPVYEGKDGSTVVATSGDPTETQANLASGGFTVYTSPDGGAGGRTETDAYVSFELMRDVQVGEFGPFSANQYTIQATSGGQTVDLRGAGNRQVLSFTNADGYRLSYGIGVSDRPYPVIIDGVEQPNQTIPSGQNVIFVSTTAADGTRTYTQVPLDSPRGRQLQQEYNQQLARAEAIFAADPELNNAAPGVDGGRGALDLAAEKLRNFGITDAANLFTDGPGDPLEAGHNVVERVIARNM